MPGEPHAPVAVARAVVHHDVELGEVAVGGAQRAGFQPQPDRNLDRRGRRLLDQPHDGSEAVVGGVRVRADGQVALGTLTGRRRRRRDLHVHGRTAVRRRFDHLGVEGEPDDPFVVGAGHRVAPRVVAAVVEMHGEPPVHRVLHADDGWLGPDPGRPADSRDHQRDLGVCVHPLVALGAQAQPQPDALRDDQRSRPDVEADPHRRAVAGQQPGLRHRDRQPRRRRDELDAVPLDDRRRVGQLQLDTPPAGTLEDDVAVGHRHLRWQRRVLPQWGRWSSGRRSGVAGTRSRMIAVAAGSADAVAAAWRWSGPAAHGRCSSGGCSAGGSSAGGSDRGGGAPHEVAAGRAELDAGRAGLTALGAHALRHATPRRTASRGDVARGAVVRVATMHTSWTDGPPGARTCSRYFRPRPHRAGERITSRARSRLVSRSGAATRRFGSDSCRAGCDGRRCCATASWTDDPPGARTCSRFLRPTRTGLASA